MVIWLFYVEVWDFVVMVVWNKFWSFLVLDMGFVNFIVNLYFKNCFWFVNEYLVKNFKILV